MSGAACQAVAAEPAASWPPRGAAYQADQVRTSCVAQEMRDEALEGHRCRSPRGDDDKLRVRRREVNDVTAVDSR